MSDMWPKIDRGGERSIRIRSEITKFPRNGKEIFLHLVRRSILGGLRRASEELVNRCNTGKNHMTLCHFLDWDYGRDGDQELRRKLQAGGDANERSEQSGEAAILVAARRRRANAIKVLLEFGADINALSTGGKTAYAHSIRRGFNEIADLLRQRGADTTLNNADRLAVLLTSGKLDDAAELIAADPEIVRTGNPEEDRLPADLAGRKASEPLELLIGAGADPNAPGLDGGTPLHQTAWFGQPHNAGLLLNAGARLDDFNNAHNGSALGWAAHGSRFSGDADTRGGDYVALVQLFLSAGAQLFYPGREGDDAYLKTLHADASEAVRALLPPLV